MGSTNLIRLSILHENNLLLEGLCALSEKHGIHVAHTFHAAHADDIRTLISSGQTDVILIGLNELMATQWTPKNGETRVARKIIVLGDSHQHSHLNFWWKKQVGGIVAEQGSFSEIHQAIRQVASGSRYRSELLAEMQANQTGKSYKMLTSRQIEILRLVSEGNSSKEIGNRLLISRKTVENHRARIYQRLGVRTAAEMVNVAKKTGWL